MPLMETIPGAGKAGNPTPSVAALGPLIAIMPAAAYATYSAVSGSAATTPTPPTSCPFLKIGTPPGFTAVATLSFKSALPVTIPYPGDAPASVVAGGTIASMLAARLQPGLVFSMPYSAGHAVFAISGGKFMPLINRPVRDERGA